MRLRLIAMSACLALPAAAAEPAHGHHVAFQMDEAAPEKMNGVLNNIDNMYAYYATRGEPVEIELVAFGPGLTMLRKDTSPVRERLAAEHAAHPALVLSGCNNTLQAMSKAESREVVLMPEARIVPAGVVRLSELQEQGWTYLRP